MPLNRSALFEAEIACAWMAGPAFIQQWVEARQVIREVGERAGGLSSAPQLVL